MTRRGRFIAFEGGEGSGKTTQAARLADRLGAVLTREPGGTPVGERVRALLLDPSLHIDVRAESLLMAAARAQHVADVVRPALLAGHDVVADRYIGSSLAYQGYGRGLPIDEVRALSEWATGGLWPDLVLLLDVPVAESARRQRERGMAEDRLEAAGEDFHERVRAGFRALAASEPHRWVVVEGLGTVEEVAALVDAAVGAWDAPPGAAGSSA